MWSGDTDPTAYPDEPPVLHSEEPVGREAPEQIDTSTPETLARALFWALVRQDEALLSHLVMSPDEYAQAARASRDRANEHMEQVRVETERALQVFRGEVPSEQRPGGLGSMLELESVNVRSYRRVSGELVRGDEPGEMVLGTELLMRLRGSEQVFRVRLPKVLITPAGQWRLAEAPQVGGMLQLFVEMGFHLSPTMLAFEHFPMPLHTGNYWEYRVRVVPHDDAGSRGEHAGTGVGSAEEEPEGSGRGGLAESVQGVGEQEAWPRFRDEVTSREDYDGYALVRVRRTHDDPTRSREQVAYLLTARRIYRCDRDCRRNISDVAWLLSYLSRRTPELIFPLQPGIGWRTGGRLSTHGEYQTRSRYEVADVPAGRFEQTVCVTRSVVEGREHRFIASGIGTVLTRIDGATATTHVELVDFRIIP